MQVDLRLALMPPCTFWGTLVHIVYYDFCNNACVVIFVLLFHRKRTIYQKHECKLAHILDFVCFQFISNIVFKTFVDCNTFCVSF